MQPGRRRSLALCVRSRHLARYAWPMRLVPMLSPPEPAPPSSDWYLVRSGEVLAVGEGSPPTRPAGPPPALAASTDTDAVFLGVAGARACWAQGVSEGTPAPPGTRWIPLRALGSMLDEGEWSIAGRAVQLVEWQRTSRFCGRCGAGTAGERGERAMRCPACGLSVYPRLSPAVIVAIERGPELLLARNASFRGRMFSTLAGFVEPGETLEEAVRREVAEEVGVELGAVRYFGSQPWPLPHSLMVGFRAEWAAGDPVADGYEIAEARWFGPGGLPELPPPLSIARRLIDSWVEDQGRGVEA